MWSSAGCYATAFAGRCPEIPVCWEVRETPVACDKKGLSDMVRVCVVIRAKEEGRAHGNQR
ncbi:hypothetical protein NITLEN_20202 [Nitrospira lenta]|uniref:Uncharacterized protein n=1 Tax=Nitrospira lenta TaxID=1436998 RepID=A0A330L5X7_9BACT|nr:hypothetical protein NITLEN_20202 [Nitrospira lenta]